jgi:beta-glucosidase
MLRPKQTILTALWLLFLTLPILAQTTLDEVVGDMTLPHEGLPHGVPPEWDWGSQPRYGADEPPADWDAAIAWGQLYEWAEGNPATNTRVQIRDLELYYLSKTDLKWRLLQSAVRVEGAAYVEDFAGDENIPADIREEPDGSISVTAGNGYNFHFWPEESRVNFPEGDVKGIFATVRARLVLDDPEGSDDRASARYLMGVGGDWWESLTAVWDNWTTNADMGIGRFRFVTSEWKSFNMISLPADSVYVYPPPFHAEGPDASQIYQDPSYPVEERVEDLLGKMTLDEKVGQMTQANWKAVSPESDMSAYFLGSLLNGGGGAPSENTPEAWADLYDRFQDQALSTRLGIPYIYGTDAVHGHNNVKGAVIFPHNIGLGCTGNETLVEEVARITALEVAATGIDWTFAPCITVPRDERWGRTYEGFSEEPELVALLGAASVRGYQGDSLTDPATIVACAKHYVGDGGTTGGIDQGNTEISEQELRNIHLRPYLDAISEDVGTIMASYNSWNGQKLHGHEYLLTTVLKEELGFEGFIISDWAAIDQIPGDYQSDIELSVNAGIDMVMVPNDYEEFFDGLKSAVINGKVSWERIEDANRRILTQKFLLGLFEEPYTDRSLLSVVGSTGHREVGRQAVRESMVLLKNKNAILPLSKHKPRLHVAGDAADNLGTQCGGWSIAWQGGSGDITEGTTVLEAIREVATGTISYRPGIDPEASSDADIAVVVIGEEPYAEGAGDRTDLSLSREDTDLLRSLHADGKKVVTLLFSGRPMLLDDVWHYSDAVIAAWLPGTEGEGITDILFGDHTPTGTLSFSWPADMEQIPVNIGDDPYEPQFPLGFGLNSFDAEADTAAPYPYSAAVLPEGDVLELTFSKPMTLEPQGSLSLSINGLPALFSTPALKDGDPNTLVLELEEAVSSRDLLQLNSTGGWKAEDGSLSEAFSLDVHNPVVDFLAVPGRIEAEDYSSMNGIQTEECSDVGGGLNVGYIETNDHMVYHLDINQAGGYTVSYRVAAQSDNRTFRMQILEGESWNTLHTVSFNATGGWQNWITVSDTLSLPEGRQILRLIAANNGFNVNWIEFTFDPTLNTGKAHLEPGYMVWPNPARHSLHMQSDGPDPVDYFLVDGAGRHIRSGEYTGRTSLDVSGLSKGLYFLRFESGSGRTVRKVMIY